MTSDPGEEQPEREVTLWDWLDLSAETAGPAADDPVLQPIPPEEKSRRTIMIVAAVAWATVNIASVVLALTVSPEHYAAAAASLTPMASLLSAALAAAVTYYFTHKEK